MPSEDAGPVGADCITDPFAIRRSERPSRVVGEFKYCDGDSGWRGVGWRSVKREETGRPLGGTRGACDSYRRGASGCREVPTGDRWIPRVAAQSGWSRTNCPLRRSARPSFASHRPSSVMGRWSRWPGVRVVAGRPLVVPHSASRRRAPHVGHCDCSRADGEPARAAGLWAFVHQAGTPPFRSMSVARPGRPASGSPTPAAPTGISAPPVAPCRLSGEAATARSAGRVELSIAPDPPS